jgi:hypothetical protein
MKVKVEFITARLVNKLLFVEAIQDCYTEVQVIISKNDLDAESLDALSGNLCVTEFTNSFNLGSYEAKDVCDVYGNLVVAIESKIIDFE